MNNSPIHSLVSPSYLKQLLQCSKSLPRDSEAVEDTNPAAEKGTLQHAYLNYLLSVHFNKPITENVDITTLNSEEIEEVNEVFNKAVEEYLFLKKKYACVDVLLEEKISLDNYLPEPSWGYVDICYIGHKKKLGADGKYKDSTIYVLDAKYGRVEVNVVDEHNNPNAQLTGYFSGIYDLVSPTHNVTRAYLMILQPKLNNYSKLSCKASKIINYMVDVIKPAATEAVNDTGTYNPSLENCKYCKNSKHCKFHNIIAIAQLQMLENPEMLSDEYIEEYVLPNITNLKKYCDNVWDYAVKKSESTNKKWKGFTLGTSRPSRVYIDEGVVKEIAHKDNIEGLITESVLSPAQAEKLLGKERFAELLADQVTYKLGKTTLVPDAPVKKTSKKTIKNDFKENN